jgi:hypothetical protein
LLKERATGDENEWVRQAAVQGFARGWKHDPAVPALLKERAAGDEHEWVRQAAVQELARGWPHDPDVQAFLRGLHAARAVSDA